MEGDYIDAGSSRSRGRGRGRGLSVSSVDSFLLYTPDEDKAVRRKFDRKLVLFVALLYMLSFLDRSNIGNARIAGMDEDLQSTSPPRDDWYEWALTSFYISYIAFEWMSLLWKVIPAHVYVSMLVLSWGLTASLQAIAVSYPMLIALRVLLGIGEAGFTGVPFYLSFFYKRQELAFRTAIFISAAPLATSFASTLAWIIVKVGQLSPIAPWRLLFLVEGFPSVIVSVIAWSTIPDSPQTAHYLTKREKKVARLRLRRETTSSSSSSSPSSSGASKKAASSRLKPREILSVLADPVAWITPAMFFLTNMAYSSLPVFLPKILTEMGHDSLTAQALAAPPYLLAFLVVLFTAHTSDRLAARTGPVVFHALSSAVGYALLALAKPLALPAWLRYLAVYPAAIGFFNVVTLVIAWNINNQPSQSRQGGGFALMQLVGQCGPLVGTRLYPDRDGPFYTRGMWTCASAMLTVAALAVVLRFYLRRKNGRLDQAEKERQEDGTIVEEEGLVVPGKKRRHADKFRYML
ncbi:MFS general substrate transporter [Trichoderma citrinoviride]|uniref:MFS general substrate transporter n=1 Tax=Trichoderma citrinoviride TaxID=58853 RepID=A0A2T4B3P8_9HYPO|nr:MFS general substrate transporter [Trichoderma citrinoviride]PTB63930.1 MFS general substrate transporter [Trichoderma citrinoviride]